VGKPVVGAVDSGAGTAGFETVSLAAGSLGRDLYGARAEAMPGIKIRITTSEDQLPNRRHERFQYTDIFASPIVPPSFSLQLAIGRLGPNETRAVAKSVPIDAIT
jgi:hypothetical protein